MQYSIKLEKDLRRNPYKGLYIAFEGIDGSGKTTQVEAVQKTLIADGKTVVVTSEPQMTGEIQQVIRNALFSKVKIPSRAYQSLYSADRAVNHAEIVEPALKRGDTVLTHRSIWSTPAYGLLDLGENYDFKKLASVLISQGNFSEYHQFIAPDITFYLKVSARHAIERLGKMDKEKDVYEKEEKLAKIAGGYDTLVSKFPEEITVIDGEQEEDKITKDILEKIIKHGT